MVESQPSKLLVAGSIPVSRSRILVAVADVAQLVEHSLGKGEVTSSILVIGSRVEAFCGRDPEHSRRGEPAAEILSVFCEGSPG